MIQSAKFSWNIGKNFVSKCPKVFSLLFYMSTNEITHN